MPYFICYKFTTAKSLGSKVKVKSLVQFFNFLKNIYSGSSAVVRWFILIENFAKSFSFCSSYFGLITINFLFKQIFFHLFYELEVFQNDLY